MKSVSLATAWRVLSGRNRSHPPSRHMAATQRLARILFADAAVMRMTADQIIDDALVGQHPVLGSIAIPISLTRELQWDAGNGHP